MQKGVVKFGAYIVLAIGILLALACLIAAFVVIMNFPTALLQKKMMIIGLLLIGGLVFALLSISVFESMTAVPEMEEEIEQLEEEVKELEHNRK